MKKKLVSFFLSTVILMSLVGCTSGAEVESVEESAEDQTPASFCLFRFNFK